MTYNFVENVTSYKITRTDNSREVQSVNNLLWLLCSGADCIAIKAEVVPFHFAQLLAMSIIFLLYKQALFWIFIMEKFHKQYL